MESPEKSVLSLPPEIMRKIMLKLSLPDLASMARACRYFYQNFENFTYVNLESKYSSTLWLGDAETLASSLTDVVNHSQVVRANFNGIYWLENHSILTSFLNLCHNIRRLDLLETTLGLQEILSLLPQQKNLTSVSLTIRHDEELDIFRKKKPFELGKLRQLTHLELAIEDAVREWDLRFLPLCTSLVKLTVARGHIFNFNIGEPTFQLNARSLKSLVFLALPESLSTIRAFYTIEAQASQTLISVWSNILDCGNLNMPLKSLRWNCLNRGRESVPHENTLSTLESVSEPFPVIMNAASTCFNLIVAKIHFNGKHFGSFCRNNKSLESLRLMHSNSRNPDKKVTNASWNDDSWSQLAKLKNLSIEADLIECSDPLDGRKRKRDEDDSASEANMQPLLAVVVQNCQSVEEFELMGSVEDSPDRDFKTNGRKGKYVLPQELPCIGNFSKLSKLTIADVDIVDGVFLIEILTNCTFIEVLRLKDLGSSETCCYSNALIEAIPLAKNLKSFCLFQRYIPLAHMVSLLQALGKCSLLTRVGLVSPRAIWELKKQTISNHFRSLCENCPNLVALFGHLTAPNNIFQDVTTSLNTMYRKSRPAFRADIISTYNRMIQENYHSDKLPLMHSGSLTSIKSNVTLLPYNCESYLHRV